MYPGQYATRHPDRAAFIMASTGEAVSYREYEARSNRLAHLLRSHGLKRLDLLLGAAQKVPGLPVKIAGSGPARQELEQLARSLGIEDRVEFLGRPASCHKAVAVFTLTGGAPLIVSYAKRVGGPLQFELGLVGVADPQVPSADLANVKTLTRWYNRMLEQAILGAPEQYWWVHRRWKGEPPKRGVARPALPPATATEPPSADRSAA